MDTSQRGSATSFSVHEHVFLDVEDDGHVAVVQTASDAEERLALLTVGRDDVRERIERAWGTHAAKPLVTSYRAKRARWRRRAAVTHDDIRRVILALPGANEGPIWGQDLGFRVGDEKRTRFARFGPPEGSRVGNLLPPDDENTLVILRCEAKPALLAACADRFFATPHYGSTEEPGGVITRLCEHRGAEDLAELAELLEEAWRDVASPELIEERERQRTTRRKKR